MNDLMTESFVGAAKQAQQDLESAGGGPAAAPAAGDEKLRLFLQEAEAAKNEMAALGDDLSRLQSVHEASKSLLKPGESRAATHAALLHLLCSARRLRARLESMDRRAASNPSAAVATGLRARLQDLTAGVQGLRRQMSAEHRDAVARCYFAVTGEAPTDELVERFVASGADVDALVRKAVAEGGAAAATREMEDRQEAAKEVEGSLVELQQLFVGMAVLVEAQGKKVGDIEQHVAAAAQDIGDGAQELQEARRLQSSARRKWLWVGLVLLLLIVLAMAAAVIAIALSRKNVNLPLMADLPFW